MTTRELIEELERYDPSVHVVVAHDNGGVRTISDVGRRERGVVGVHPVIYLTYENKERSV